MTEGVARILFVQFVLGCVCARNVRSPSYCFKKGFFGNPKAVLANRIIICIYFCSCVFLSRFGRDLNPIRDG